MSKEKENFEAENISEKVRRKRRIVAQGHKKGWPVSKIQSVVRQEHAKARRYIIEQYMPEKSIGAEVGVDWGDFAELIVEIASPKKYYLVDPWGANPKKPGDRPKHISTIFSKQIKDGSIIVIRKTGLQAAKEIPDDSMDWAYIDCSHRKKDIIDNITSFLPKIKVGRYLIGDDYDSYFRYQVSVADGFDNFVKDNPERVKVIHKNIETCQIVLQRIK